MIFQDMYKYICKYVYTCNYIRGNIYYNLLRLTELNTFSL